MYTSLYAVYMLCPCVYPRATCIHHPYTPLQAPLHPPTCHTQCTNLLRRALRALDTIYQPLHKHALPHTSSTASPGSHIDPTKA